MRLRIHYGDVIAELIEPIGESKNHCVIVLQGLPNQPRNEEFGNNLAKEGFHVLQPRYIGSWESYGDFSLENCLKTLIESVKMIRKGEVLEVFNNKKINISCDKISIISSSFGSAIAMSFPEVDNYVCLCPLLNLKQHSKDESKKEQDLIYLVGFLKRGWENAFRGFNEKDWESFVSGKSKVDPYKYLDKFEGKNILLIHGTNDEIVHYSRTVEFAKKLKDKNNIDLNLVKGAVHGSALAKLSSKEVVNFLNKFR
ncbi:MAG: S9 family peptidase [Nanoarchaeota archaeon]|nr:S9 family peptidase [Nanoarchaeota archaeon]MBU1501227.1 S9 family peptidase [Nanoarchaeota archaeon]